MTEDLAALLGQVPEDLRAKALEVSPRRLALCLELARRRLPGLVVCAEAVHRRHNVSAILRSAEAVGVHEAHLITEGDFLPSVGAAKGAERWMELSLHHNTAGCFDALRARGFGCWIADLAPDARPPWEVPLERPVAVLFGSEVHGVSAVARAQADGVITLPMYGVTQSLNVAAAAAVILSHLSTRLRARPGAVGLGPEDSERLLRRFLERETARSHADSAWWGPLTSGEEPPDPDA